VNLVLAVFCLADADARRTHYSIYVTSLFKAIEGKTYFTIALT
jgi:hypothetical protein